MKIIIAGSEGLIGKSLSSHLEKEGHEVLKLDLSLGHDFTNESFVKKFFKDNNADSLINLFAQMHHVDGTQEKSTLFNISLDSFSKYMDINLTALFSVCREYARNNSYGSIINFSSTYGVVSPPTDIYDQEEKHIGYSVSKAGDLMLTKHLATHLAPNIRVNTIIPGGIDNEQTDKFKKQYSAKTPLGRMMDVKELNGIMDYLISNKSSYTTGAEFKIDGGWTAW